MARSSFYRKSGTFQVFLFRRLTFEKKSSRTQILVIEAIVFDETFNFLQTKPLQTGSQPALIDHCWEPAAAAMRDL